jgi:hypothetical protein
MNFNSILEDPTGAMTQLNMQTAMLTIGVSIALGIVIGIAYMIVARKKGVSFNLAMTLMILPVIVAVMILMIGSNIAKAFSLAGICTLVRFRSIPGDSKDITFIFLSVTSGLAVGMGYVTYAAVFTLIVLVVVIVYMLLVAGPSDDNVKVLRITIPEDLNYQDTFEDLFKEYTKSYRVERVKTINLGTLYELTYVIRVKNGIDEKKFIDSIRERNGNLNIMLMRMTPEADKL